MMLWNLTHTRLNWPVLLFWVVMIVGFCAVVFLTVLGCITPE